MGQNQDVSLITTLVEEKKTTGLQITANSRLIEDAGIDSVALMELIEAVQTESGVVFMPEDYRPENFETVDSLAQLLLRRRSGI